MNTTKAVLRTLSLVMIVMLILTSLCACSGGVTREETRSAMDALLTALDNENYTEAVDLYHPDAAMTEDLLVAFTEEIQNEVGIDLTEGATVERTTNMRSAYYDSTVDGSLYALTARIKAGDKTATLTVEVIRNDRGYGIYKVACNP